METLVSLCPKQTREYPHPSQPNQPQNLKASIKCQFLGLQSFKSIGVLKNRIEQSPTHSKASPAETSTGNPKPTQNKTLTEESINFISDC